MLEKVGLTNHIIDPLHPLEVRKVDPSRQMSAPKKPVQVIIAHVLNRLSSALLL